MYKRSFNIKSLPPITLEDFKKYSFKEYITNCIKLIENNNEYFLVKSFDDIIKINKKFFDFLVDEKTIIIHKTIYIIPLSGQQDIIIEEFNNNKTATVFFKTFEESLNFEIPKFFGTEIIDDNMQIDYDYSKIK